VTPRIPVGPTRARNAVATTTVGRTNGTVVAARIADRPGMSSRAITQVAGSATASVRMVDAAACHTVNHPTPRRCPSPTTRVTAPNPPSLSPVARIETTGHTKKAPRKATGTTASRTAVRRVTAGPSPSATSGPGSLDHVGVEAVGGEQGAPNHRGVRRRAGSQTNI
jgi:hypothetical protein